MSGDASNYVTLADKVFILQVLIWIIVIFSHLKLWFAATIHKKIHSQVRFTNEPKYSKNIVI